VLTVPAKVVSKRENVSVSHHTNGNSNLQHRHTSTTYYATFEFESGDRKEFDISGSEYGVLVEDDRGNLTFQGTRYKGFQRGIHRREVATPPFVSEPAAPAPTPAPAPSVLPTPPMPAPPVAQAPEPPPQPAPSLEPAPQNAPRGHCATCNIELEGNFKFCPSCGKPLTFD
jgi:cell division septation protein DedD